MCDVKEWAICALRPPKPPGSGGPPQPAALHHAHLFTSVVKLSVRAHVASPMRSLDSGAPATHVQGAISQLVQLTVNPSLRIRSSRSAIMAASSCCLRRQKVVVNPHHTRDALIDHSEPPIPPYAFGASGLRDRMLDLWLG